MNNNLNSFDQRIQAGYRPYLCPTCNIQFWMELANNEDIGSFICETCQTPLEGVSFQNQHHTLTSNNNSSELNHALFEYAQYYNSFILPFLANLQQDQGHQNHIDILIFSNENQHHSETPLPAANDVIQKLPRISFNKDLKLQQVICYICQEEYVENERLIGLYCQHDFHEDCIFKWLNINGTCPVCRLRVQNNHQQ